MDKENRLSKTARGAVAIGAFVALTLNFSNLTYARGVSERDLPGASSPNSGAYYQGSYDPVTGQVNAQTPSAESLHGEAVVANSVSPATVAKDNFANGGKSLGRGFKNGAKATGRGFKKAGTTVAKGFKKAGGGIKWFFTGQWLSKKDKGEAESQDLRAERPTEVYEQESYSPPAYESRPVDDLDLDFEEGAKPSNDWVKQERRTAEQAS